MSRTYSDKRDVIPSMTPEDEKFLEQYTDELSSPASLSTMEMNELCRRAGEGDSDARIRLLEQLLPDVPDLVEESCGKGVPLSDLVQEGNLALMLALDSLGSVEEGTDPYDFLAAEVETAAGRILEDQLTEKREENSVADRLNLITDTMNELSDGEEGNVSIEEVSEYLDMPVEEIEALIRLTGAGSEDGSSGRDGGDKKEK